MKLSKDQIRIIKSEAITVITFIVVYPLMMFLLGKQMSWGDFLWFAGIMIVIGVILGFFLTLGSKVPKE